MSIKKITKILNEFYNPVKYRINKYPKAAKKRRVLKKWINRFGKDGDEIIRELLLIENPFLRVIEKNCSFSGKYHPVPLYLDPK